jgi:hypothetical protein
MNLRDIEHMWKRATNNPNHDSNWHDPAVIKFAEMIATHTLLNTDPSSFMSWQEGFEAGRLAERKACAKVCDDIRNDWKTHGDEMKTYAAEYLVNAIRARGQA